MGAPFVEGLRSVPPDARAARKKGTSVKEKSLPNLREYQEVTIGNDGIVLQRGAPQAYPLIDFYIDVDDTLLQSSRVKGIRQRQYQVDLSQAGIRIADATAERVMKTTYTVAQDRVGEGSYLTDNHVRLLAWVTDQMAEAKEGQERENLVDQTVTRLREEGIRETDPFRIRDEILELTYDSPSLPALEEMFERTLLETEEFRETVDAVAELCRRRDQGMPIRVNFLTRGYPPESEIKVDGVMGRNTDVRPDRIFITRVRKDEFMHKARESVAYRTLPLTYPDGEVRTEGDVNLYPHVVVGVDDSNESLNSQANMAGALAERGADLALVRLRRDGTKDGKDDWEMQGGDHLEIDLRRRTMTGVELAEALVRRGELYLHKMRGSIPPRQHTELDQAA